MVDDVTLLSWVGFQNVLLSLVGCTINTVLRALSESLLAKNFIFGKEVKYSNEILESCLPTSTTKIICSWKSWCQEKNIMADSSQET